MPRDEHDGDLEPEIGHSRLEIEPAQARHPDVEHQAAGNVVRRMGKELLRGTEGLDTQPGRSDQAGDRLQREDLMQSAVIMAAFVWHAAMRNDLLPRKPVPVSRGGS